ncbi:MAG: hypothetical protein ACFFHV_22640 [Promethearchaeota archaeon]
MCYNECQKDIIYYIIDYYNDFASKITPCIEAFGVFFKEKYTNLELEECIRELVSRGILRTLSFHAYLDFTETFKTSHDYKLFKERKI